MKTLSRLSLAIMIELGFTTSLIPTGALAAEVATDPDISSNASGTASESTMMVTAAGQTLQAPSVSTITADEIKKRPPTRDVSEIICTMPGVNLTGNSTSGRSPYSQAEIFSLFAEDNIELTDSTMLTPDLRFDHYPIVGNNWSPSLKLSQILGDDFTLKMGIARAYKVPSLCTRPNRTICSTVMARAAPQVPVPAI